MNFTFGKEGYYYSYCKECVRKNSAKYRKENHTLSMERARANYRKKAFKKAWSDAPIPGVIYFKGEIFTKELREQWRASQ